jgi:hypothetical protein
VQEFHLWILIAKTGEPRDTILVCRDGGRLEVTAVLAALAYPELASAAPRHGKVYLILYGSSSSSKCNASFQPNPSIVNGNMGRYGTYLNSVEHSLRLLLELILR